MHWVMYRRWRIPIHDFPQIRKAESRCAIGLGDGGLYGVGLARLARFPDGSSILRYELLGPSEHLGFRRLHDLRLLAHVVVLDGDVVIEIVIDSRTTAD